MMLTTLWIDCLSRLFFYFAPYTDSQSHRPSANSSSKQVDIYSGKIHWTYKEAITVHYCDMYISFGLNMKVFQDKCQLADPNMGIKNLFSIWHDHLEGQSSSSVKLINHVMTQVAIYSTQLVTPCLQRDWCTQFFAKAKVSSGRVAIFLSWNNDF